MDIDNLARNTADGLHMASLAGVWSAIVAGFGGMRASPSLGFAPRLPTDISRLAFRVCYRGRHLSVTVTAGSATYELVDGAPITIAHHGSPIELGDTPVALAIPPMEVPSHVHKPRGRAPAKRVTARLSSRAPERDGRPASGH